MVDSQPTPEPLPPGHVTVAVMLTGGMGLTLAGGLHFFGWIDVFDRNLHGIFASAGTPTPVETISPAAIWLASTGLAFGLAWAMLEMPGTWRRITIWVCTQVMILAWMPVAAIAKSTIPVGVPWIACAWSGLCAIIYATRHRMPVDAVPYPGSSDEPAATNTHGND